MNHIFISYRRKDSADVTGRIYDRLCSHYGDDAIFKDVDNIPLGADFRAVLDEAVSRCNILLAVIGRDWLTLKDDRGQSRLADATDFVRIEIESALQRNIPVVPLLVHGTRMPAADQLPPSLQDLTFRNGIPIRPDPDFHKDMDRLIKGLDGHLQAARAPQKGRAGASASDKVARAKQPDAPQPAGKAPVAAARRQQAKRQKAPGSKEKPPEKAAGAQVTDPLQREVTDHRVKAEFWKFLLINIAGVIVGLVPGFLLSELLMTPLYGPFGGDEMVITLLLITACGASVGAMQSLRLRRDLYNREEWIMASVVGWVASGLFIGVLLAGDVFSGWVTLMILLPFVGGAFAGMLQKRALRPIAARANLWWLTSALAWPAGALIGRIFADPREPTILLVPLGGLLCWLVGTAYVMARLLTFREQNGVKRSGDL